MNTIGQLLQAKKYLEEMMSKHDSTMERSNEMMPLVARIDKLLFRLVNRLVDSTEDLL